MIFSVDISVSALENLLDRRTTSFPGYLFLTNNSCEFILTGKNAKIKTPLLRLLQNEVCETLQHKNNDVTAFKIPGRETWIGSLRPLINNRKSLWIGVKAREKDLILGLKKNTVRHRWHGYSRRTVQRSGNTLFCQKTGFFSDKTNQKKDFDPRKIVQCLLQKGEDNHTEFKSTVRTNLKTLKQGEEIELAWLKAVTAFLNADGGDLLIGVSDDARVLGLEADNFANRCQLHVKNEINQHIGCEFSRIINIQTLSLKNREILHITYSPSPEPVFLKMGKNEDFFIRSGPSNTKLKPSQIIKYVQTRNQAAK